MKRIDNSRLRETAISARILLNNHDQFLNEPEIGFYNYKILQKHLHTSHARFKRSTILTASNIYNVLALRSSQNLLANRNRLVFFPEEQFRRRQSVLGFRSVFVF